jgi:glycosyltransferase involved in cell wall biosynthesis
MDWVSGPMNSYVVANCHAVRDDYLHWVPFNLDRFLVIYNGIDNDDYCPITPEEKDERRRQFGISPQAKVIGIVGRLSPEKDHLTFLNAVHSLQGSVPNLKALIVGDGAMRKTLELSARRLGLANVVHFLGERRDARGIIQIMDVIVMTSFSEGLPNVLLEACALAVPVVTTAAGGASEVVLDGITGFVVPCRDAEALAARVQNLLAADELRVRFCAAAQERIRVVFSAEEMARRIMRLYEQEPVIADISEPFLARQGQSR